MDKSDNLKRKSMGKVEGTVLIEDARIVFKNFKGEEGPFNREGDRNFAVLLDDALADELKADGWNVKYLKVREENAAEGETPQAYVQVSVGYKNKPPNITLITSKNRTHLGEDEVEMLDWADIAHIDLIFQPYNWVVQEGTDREARGVKAYLKTMFVTIHEDELELKYAEDMPARAGRIDD